MEYYLKPIYDSRKSFYKKAIVKTENNEALLLSYGYHIGSIFANNKYTFLFNDNFLNNEDLQTLTTFRHIREFLRQNDIKKIGILCENHNAIDVNFDFKMKDIKRLIEANL